METRILLIARYDALPIIPLEPVCSGFFQPLVLEEADEKIKRGHHRYSCCQNRAKPKRNSY
jgi:hypothetical protein